MSLLAGFIALSIIQIAASFRRGANDRAQRRRELELESRNRMLEERVHRLRGHVQNLEDELEQYDAGSDN